MLSMIHAFAQFSIDLVPEQQRCSDIVSALSNKNYYRYMSAFCNASRLKSLTLINA